MDTQSLCRSESSAKNHLGCLLSCPTSPLTQPSPSYADIYVQYAVEAVSDGPGCGDVVNLKLVNKSSENLTLINHLFSALAMASDDLIRGFVNAFHMKGTGTIKGSTAQVWSSTTDFRTSKMRHTAHTWVVAPLIKAVSRPKLVAVAPSTSKMQTSQRSRLPRRHN